MDVIAWLKEGDPSLGPLVERHLLDKQTPPTTKGIIGRYLELFDEEASLWGEGTYSPKWISTHYTMMELAYMEIDPMHPTYQKAMRKLWQRLWRDRVERKGRDLDLCIVGMLTGLLAYGKAEEELLGNLVEHILGLSFPDGGWNCEWSHKTKRPQKSSLHTTISVLEGLHRYLAEGYIHHAGGVAKAMSAGEEFILAKRLFRAERTDETIHPEMVGWHYPPRWRYDIFRALEHFAARKRPFDSRMEEALGILIDSLDDHGRAPRGPQYPGRIHFRLEKTAKGRFNTLRALKILKCYHRELFTRLTGIETSGAKNISRDGGRTWKRSSPN